MVEHNITDDKKYPYIMDIKRKMNTENAKSVSDLEIERCLKNCILGTGLIKLAVKYRNKGVLIFKDSFATYTGYVK